MAYFDLALCGPQRLIGLSTDYSGEVVPLMQPWIRDDDRPNRKCKKRVSFRVFHQTAYTGLLLPTMTREERNATLGALDSGQRYLDSSGFHHFFSTRRDAESQLMHRIDSSHNPQLVAV
jgi:hypothetical protein